jgi:hypothetical protein
VKWDWEYTILACVAVAFFIWLTWWVLPGRAIIMLSPIAKGELYHGPAYGIVSSSTRGKTNRMEVVRRDEWQRVTECNTGWRAVFAWTPVAMLVALLGCIGGWFLGRYFQKLDYKIIENKRIAEGADQVEQARTRLIEAQALDQKGQAALNEANRLCRSAQAEKQAIQNAAAAQVLVANTRAGEAERKLENERAEHKEAMAKAGARIKELKGKK